MLRTEKFSASEPYAKQTQYDTLLKKIRSIIYQQSDLDSILEAIAKQLHQSMHFSWTGFYFAQTDGLVPGPYEGPAKSRQLSAAENACYVAFTEECIIVVDDVEEFPGHIPCGDFEKSEIVLPAFKKGEIALLLNVVSPHVKCFDETDRRNLQEVMHMIEEVL